MHAADSSLSRSRPRHRWRRTPAFVALAGIAAIAPRAHAAIAQTPTPAHIVALLSFNLFPPNPNPIEVLTFGEHQLAGPGGRLRIDSALFPSPFLHASVVEIRDGFFGRVSATLDYEVMVVGPDGTVPVLFAASGEVEGNALPSPPGSGSFTMKATWSLSNVAGGTPLFHEGGIVTPQRGGSFFDDFISVVGLDLPANQRIRVKLTADVGINNGVTNGGIGNARAFVDPVFSFATGVGPEYSFVFSDGVGNLPIPEPATSALMAAGLLALGLAGRRRDAESMRPIFSAMAIRSSR